MLDSCSPKGAQTGNCVGKYVEGESWTPGRSAQINLKRASRLRSFPRLLATEYEKITLAFLNRTELDEWEGILAWGVKPQTFKPSPPDRDSPRPPQELSFSGILMREGGRTLVDVDIDQG